MTLPMCRALMDEFVFVDPWTTKEAQEEATAARKRRRLLKKMRKGPEAVKPPALSSVEKAVIARGGGIVIPR